MWGAAGRAGIALKDLSSTGPVGISQGQKKESGTIPLVLLLVPSPFSFLSKRSCLVRNLLQNTRTVLQWGWRSANGKIWDEKEEFYDLKKCSSANGIKYNSMKVKDHILRRKGISAITWELLRGKERCGYMNQSQNVPEQLAWCGRRKRFILYLGVSETMCLAQNSVLRIFYKTLVRLSVYNYSYLFSGKMREQERI